MWRGFLVALTALTIAGSTLIYAQQPPGPGRGDDRYVDGRQGDGRHGDDGHELSPEDRAAFLNARIAGLKAGLGLSAAQEKNWTAFEQAIRDLAKLRAERMQVRLNAMPPTDPIDRLRRRADAMSGIGGALKQLADSAQPLYQSLDDSQKRRFMVLARHFGPPFGHHMGAHHGDESERSHEDQPGRGR